MLLQGETFLVSTLLSQPYVNWKEDGLGRVGDPRMGGMFADVFHAIQVCAAGFQRLTPKSRKLGTL